MKIKRNVTRWGRSSKMIKLIKPAFLGACLAFAPLSAGAVSYLDFTDSSEFSGVFAPGVQPIVTSFAGVTTSISASGSLNFLEIQDGSTCPSELACETDGAGVLNDEISGVAVGEEQELLIEFEEAVQVGFIYLLDLFVSPGGAETEEAEISWDGGLTWTSFFANPAEVVSSGTSGLLLIDFTAGGTTSGLFTTSLLFRAPFGDPNDVGLNDYAVAAVAAVPVPAASLLLLTALGGLAISRRRRRPS